MARLQITAQPTKKTGQEARRLRRKYTDMHGRTWSAEVDVKAEKPDACSPFEPLVYDTAGNCLGQWTAAYLPDQKYLSIDPADDRLLKIDYDRALRDLETAHEDWRKDLVRYATQMYHDEETVAKVLDAPTQLLLDLCGPKPMHPNVIKAAMVGHPWTIGHPGKLVKGRWQVAAKAPDWAEEYIPKPVTRNLALNEDDAFVKQLRAELAKKPAPITE